VTTEAIATLLDALRQFRVHDASPVIEPDMAMFLVYEPPEITRLFSHDERGAAANRLTLAEHTGTHVDAPFHFDPDGLTVDRLAPDALLLRPFKKLDLSGADPAPGELLGADALAAAAERAGVAIEPGDVAIIEMGWDRHRDRGAWWGRNSPGLDESACRYLFEAGIVAVASDTGGCDVALTDGEMGGGDGHSSWFLPRGVLIVEGLQGLAEVRASGLFLALPLKIADGTGSPLRVLLLD
jgi:kynurenine formamidase